LILSGLAALMAAFYVSAAVKLAAHAASLAPVADLARSGW
jgi:hypothetical protein